MTRPLPAPEAQHRCAAHHAATQNPDFSTPEEWARWNLRELAHLRLHHALTPQAHALVAHGYLTADEATGLLSELRGLDPPRPTPTPTDLQLDLPLPCGSEPLVPTTAPTPPSPKLRRTDALAET